MSPTFAEAVETLELLPEWEQRYTYVIELAKHLPAMAEAEKTEESRVRGCTAQVWLTHSWQGAGEGATLHLNLDADALIVRGLLALIWLAYHGQTRASVHQQNVANSLLKSGLMQHLSPNRRNGFASVEARIHQLASV